MRCKGNSSTGINGSKKPLNLTIDSFVDGQRLCGFDVINFNSNYNDPTQMREAILLSLLGESHGRAAPDALTRGACALGVA